MRHMRSRISSLFDPGCRFSSAALQRQPMARAETVLIYLGWKSAAVILLPHSSSGDPPTGRMGRSCHHFSLAISPQRGAWKSDRTRPLEVFGLQRSLERPCAIRIPCKWPRNSWLSALVEPGAGQEHRLLSVWEQGLLGVRTRRWFAAPEQG